MQNKLSDSIKRILKDLKQEILRDSWNLTRDDHDAIEIRIDQLEQFIKDKYRERVEKICK